MTDRTDHRAAAERLLADADEWAAQAGELSPKASERACLDRAAVHALLAILDAADERDGLRTWQERVADALADFKPEPVTYQPSTTPDVDAADRYAANEARQREAEPDPLDEEDHRDRVDRHGDLWVRNPGGRWHVGTLRSCRALDCEWTLAYLNEHYGPLAFAPDAAQEATGDDLSAPEGESGSEERGEAERAVEPLLCPIAEAVKAERLKLAGELRVLLSTWRDDGVPLAFELLATRWEQP